MRRLWLLPLALALAPAPALALNRLTNGEFATDVSGWGTTEPVSFVWDPLDVDASPGSGSLKMTTMPPGMNPGFHGAVSECVTVTAGEKLEVAAWAYIPSNQVGPVQAAIGLRTFSSPNCQTLDLVRAEAGPITTELDQWVELSFIGSIQPGEIAARVYVQARESAGGMQDPTTTHWDAVFLPEPGSESLAAGVALLAWLRARRGKPVARSSSC